MTIVRVRCDQCDVKIPKQKPVLICDICNEIKHLKCQKLTKAEASKIISSQTSWTCYECVSDILPVSVAPNPKIPKSTVNKYKVKCAACNGYSYTPKNVRVCQWCDSNVHVKCWNGSLGCKSCCESMVPGFNVYSHELNGIEYRKNDQMFNPYSSSHFAMQIGNVLDRDTEQNSVWSEISDFLISCNYKNMTYSSKDTPPDTELNIFSLNVQHLYNKIDHFREDIDYYQNFDLLCLNECNLKKDMLPNGTSDLLLEGFHEPIIQEPIRASGKGGGLTIYVNKRVCDEDDIEEFDPNPEPANTCGEFQFLKVKNCKGSNKTVVIGNVYRSPARNPENFNSLLENILHTLNRHVKNKLFYLVGDFNQDLIKYDTDANSQNLVNTAMSHGLVQLVSRPTRLTEHTATLIDHVYTNNLDCTLSCNIVTLDLSDHLAIHTKVSLNPNSPNIPKTKNRPDTGHRRDFRMFNEANNYKFKTLIDDENWEEVYGEMDTQDQYNKFTKIYMAHYNTAYPIKSQRKRRKNERQSPKPWILPWLEDACARKKLLYHEFVLEPTVKNKTKYEKMEKFCKKHVNIAKAKYYSSYLEEYKENSRKQWELINSLLNRNKKKGNINKLIDKDGTVINTPSAIAEHFNEYFSNIATTLKNDINNRAGHTESTNGYVNFLRQPVQNSIYIRKTNPQEIFEVIKKVKEQIDIRYQNKCSQNRKFFSQFHEHFSTHYKPII